MKEAESTISKSATVQDTPRSGLDDSPCSLPPYDEWRKLPPDDAARILAKARGLDADQEGLIAAILEHFREEKVNIPSPPSTAHDTETRF